MAQAQALAAAAAAFEETLQDLGFTDGELGDPIEVGRRAALLVSADTMWRHRLGDLLDSKQVAMLLQTTQVEVNRLAEQDRLLGLPTKSGFILFPGFQFSRTGKIEPALPAILEAFAGSVVSPFTIASWFVTPNPLLRRLSPAKWLERGLDPELLVEAARRSSQSLGQ